MLSRLYNFRENLGRILLIIACMVLFTNTNIFLGLLLWIQQFGGWSPLTLPCLSGATLNFLVFILHLTFLYSKRVRRFIDALAFLVLLIYGLILIGIALAMIPPPGSLYKWWSFWSKIILVSLAGVLSLSGALGIFLKVTKGLSRNE